jgi:membrane protein required for colicin V production
MPITLLDAILIGIMLISGLLAMIRGFMREVLSISAWLIAAGAAFYAFQKLTPLAKNYFGNWPDWLTGAVVAGGAFVITLLIVTIITTRFSDMVLDSRIGALDRTLGFAFGLARGLLIVAVAFTFVDWMVPTRSQYTWISEAKSKVVLKGTGEWLESLLPEDIDKYLSAVLKRKSKPEEGEPSADGPTPGQRSGLDTPTQPGGYASSDRSGMQQLIRGKPAAR